MRVDSVTFMHEAKYRRDYDGDRPLVLDRGRGGWTRVGTAVETAEGSREAALQPERQEEEMIRVKVAKDMVSVAFRTRKHDWYTATEDPDGTIHLVPFAESRMRLRPLPDRDLEKAGS